MEKMIFEERITRSKKIIFQLSLINAGFRLPPIIVRSPLFTRFCFLNDDSPALQFSIVQCFNSIQCLFIIIHFNEAETSGTAGEFIHNEHWLKLLRHREQKHQ